MVAAWEREAASARVQGALDYKCRNGERVGAVPYGPSLGRDKRTLVTNTHERRGIALAKRLRAAGWSYGCVCAELDRRGFKPKQIAKWGSSALQAILKRRTN